MPFKTVSQPRRVASLEGSIQGASFHRKLGTVAMVSTNPVQVVTVPHTGSPAKSFTVQLEEARDVALLSRDMAVVRTDTDVWQVLDIQHKARVDPLTRDARMIVGIEQGIIFDIMKMDIVRVLRNINHFILFHGSILFHILGMKFTSLIVIHLLIQT